MFDLDKWLEIFSTLRRNKLRTILTASGVFWGIFMLVLMLGFGAGLNRGVKKNMIGFMANRIYIWGGRTTKAYVGLKPGRVIRYENVDVELLKRELPLVTAVSPTLELAGWRDGASVTHRQQAGNFRVTGVGPQFSRVDKLAAEVGRSIHEVDVAQRRKVAVIGRRVRSILFPNGEDPIGRYVAIRGVFFQVVGVFHSEKPGDAGERDDGSVQIPLSTLQTAYNRSNAVGVLTLLVDSKGEAVDVEAQARAVLARKYRVHPDDRQGIGSFNEGAQFQRYQRLFVGMEFFMWFVGVTTMLAGTIGVSNIMLISVKERTREIGVRKALGATPWSIVRLIMQESAMLTVLSGYLGLVAGVCSLELLSRVLEGAKGPVAAPSIDITTALAATGLLVITGILAGIGPARHAARVEPALALRAE